MWSWVLRCLVLETASLAPVTQSIDLSLSMVQPVDAPSGLVHSLRPEPSKRMMASAGGCEGEAPGLTTRGWALR